MSERYDWDNLPTDKGDIEDMLAKVEGEIAEITAQLMTEDRGEDWVVNARKARSFRFKVKAKLERRLATPNGAAEGGQIRALMAWLQAGYPDIAIEARMVLNAVAASRACPE